MDDIALGKYLLTGYQFVLKNEAFMMNTARFDIPLEKGFPDVVTYWRFITNIKTSVETLEKSILDADPDSLDTRIKQLVFDQISLLGDQKIIEEFPIIESERCEIEYTIDALDQRIGRLSRFLSFIKKNPEDPPVRAIVKGIEECVVSLEKESLVDVTKKSLDERIQQLEVCKTDLRKIEKAEKKAATFEASKIECTANSLNTHIDQLLRFHYSIKRNPDYLCFHAIVKDIEKAVIGLEAQSLARVTKESLRECVQQLELSKSDFREIVRMEKETEISEVDKLDFAERIKRLKSKLDLLDDVFEVICSETLHCFLKDPESHKEMMWNWIKNSFTKYKKKSISFFECLNFFFNSRMVEEKGKAQVSEDEKKLLDQSLKIFCKFNWKEILPEEEALLVVTGRPVPIFFPISMDRLFEDHPLTWVTPSAFLIKANADNNLGRIKHYISVVQGYGGISEENVFSVLTVADYFKDEVIVAQCCEFLKKKDIFLLFKQLAKRGKLNLVFKTSFDRIISAFNRFGMYKQLNDIVKAILILLFRIDSAWLDTVITERISNSDILVARWAKEIKKCKWIDVESVFRCLERLKNLTNFDRGEQHLFFLNITDDHLYFMKKWLGPFKSLNLSGCTEITDKGLSYLNQNSQLCEVILKNNPQITVLGILGIPGLKEYGLPETLEKLTIINCEQITEEQILQIREFRPNWNVVVGEKPVEREKPLAVVEESALVV